MKKERWLELEKGDKKLTEEELNKGWHFCPDWDYLLIGPGMWQENECCLCEEVDND